MILHPRNPIGVYSTALPVRRVRADGNGRATRVVLVIHGALVAGGAASRTNVATASTLLVGARAVRVVRALLDALAVVLVRVRALEPVWAALLVFGPRLAVRVGAAAFCLASAASVVLLWINSIQGLGV